MPDLEKVNADSYFRQFASFALERQAKNDPPAPGDPPDYTGEDGLLYCGKCHTPRQMWLKNKVVKEPVKVPIACTCRQEADRKQREAEEARKDMEQIRRLRISSLMDEKFRESTFDSFSVNKYNARTLKLCRRYAEAFREMMEKNQGLLLYGNVGTGKTFSAACIANYLLDRKVPTVMTSFIKILEATKPGSQDTSQFISRLNRAKLLIIDDLGTERSTEYALERVYDIIDSRYRSRLPMILTTNLTVDEMVNCKDIRFSRIYDRIFEVCYPIEFKGPSWRKVEASRRFEEMAKFLEE